MPNEWSLLVVSKEDEESLINDDCNVPVVPSCNEWTGRFVE